MKIKTVYKDDDYRSCIDMQSNTEKQLLFFCYGDSRNASTWSNVPYCFAKALENKGYKVIRVNLASPKWLNDAWNDTFFRVIRHFLKGCVYSYDRTLLSTIVADIKILWFSLVTKDIKCSIFTSFGYSSIFSSLPSIQLCDWTLEYFITQRLKRAPYYLEKLYIKRENRAIRRTKISISLFRDCIPVIENQLPGVIIHAIKGNVVNIIDPIPIDESNLIREKKLSNKVLFIGDIRYIEGAKLLLSAVLQLRKHHFDVKLVVVGMTYEELGVIDDPALGVECLGYLNKTVTEDQVKYYYLLRKARLIVNPNKVWAGFSSIVEAMYYYTPVIVSPYSSFVDTFGSDISFGAYYDGETSEELAQMIVDLFESLTFENMCLSAHDATKLFTWDNYVSQLELLIEGQP